MEPKVDVPKTAAGLLNDGVLKTLNASTRNCSLACSVRSGKFLNREKSVVTNPGPFRMLRPALPYVNGVGGVKAADEMQPTKCPSPQLAVAGAMRFGRSAVGAPVLAGSPLVVSLIGVPACIVVTP